MKRPGKTERLGWLCMLLLLAGCGPRYGKRVDSALVQRLPYETRIELLEAENDLAIAIDKMDEAQNEISRTRDQLRRAKDRRGAASDEVGAAKDATSHEVAELAVKEADARVDYLYARQDVNVSKGDIEQLTLRCASARFELARLTAARKAKVEGSERYDPKDFEAQVKHCDLEVAERRADLKDGNARFTKARDAWDVQKQALARKTFDARASPFVE